MVKLQSNKRTENNRIWVINRNGMGWR